MDESKTGKNDRGCLIAFLVMIGFLICIYLTAHFEVFGIIFAIVLIGGLLVFAYYRSFAVEETREKERVEKVTLEKKHDAFISGIITHFEGLPFPQNTIINVYYGKNKMTFVKDHQEVVLNLDKISFMDIVSGKDIQAQTTGAIAGKLIIGGIGGAALGALISAKIYYVITYGNINESKSIILDTSGGVLSGYSLNVDRIIKDFKNNHHREVKNIEL